MNDCYLQLDFAVTVSAMLGIPFPFGRCSVRILLHIIIVILCKIYMYNEFYNMLWAIYYYLLISDRIDIKNDVIGGRFLTFLF